MYVATKSKCGTCALSIKRGVGCGYRKGFVLFQRDISLKVIGGRIGGALGTFAPTKFWIIHRNFTIEMCLARLLCPHT